MDQPQKPEAQITNLLTEYRQRAKSKTLTEEELELLRQAKDSFPALFDQLVKFYDLVVS